MLKTREQMETEERGSLASYAQLASQSAGRVHPEPQHPYRTVFQRDRARIIHSRAFRRLEYKTQVFLNGTGDHLRTRLTHTIEVASISRTLACALSLNEDLAEAIALSHDLGHSPFGHCGEERLNELMRKFGGFEHNLQSLRIVEKLERKYPAFDGLNLSYEVLEGLRKHENGYLRPPFQGNLEERFPMPSLEAQIANLSDEITYYSHDLDDGLDYQLIDAEQLEDLEIWSICADRVKKLFPNLKGKRFVTYVIRSLIDFEVADVVAETQRQIENSGVKTCDDVRRHEKKLAAYSPELRRANAQLRKFLYRNVYHHEAVSEANQRGCNLLQTMFEACLSNPEQMGDYAEEHAGDPIERVACDYLSGMTDRFIQLEFERLQK
tara:strand:- start:6620 stop:7762 length:1143 start_codon:yes stop_codon:yes gene_type:complete